MYERYKNCSKRHTCNSKHSKDGLLCEQPKQYNQTYKKNQYITDYCTGWV